MTDAFSRAASVSGCLDRAGFTHCQTDGGGRFGINQFISSIFLIHLHRSVHHPNHRRRKQHGRRVYVVVRHFRSNRQPCRRQTHRQIRYPPCQYRLNLNACPLFIANFLAWLGGSPILMKILVAVLGLFTFAIVPSL